MRRVHLIPALLAAACTHVDTMSAEQHTARASQLQERADFEESQFKPNARAVAVPLWNDPLHGPGAPDRPISYNPTTDTLLLAARHREAAARHLAAAAELNAFEDKECEGIPEPERPACPLITGRIRMVQEMPWGVELWMKDGVAAGPLAQRMRCHFAFARKRGFPAPTCPLYQPGVEITVGEQGAAISVRAPTTALARAVRDDARQLFAPRSSIATTDAK